MSEVIFQKINKSYGKTAVVADLNLKIEAGSFTVLVGPSGCGKSTILRMIAGLEEITSGTLTIGGRDVTHAEPKDREIAMVFQSYALYPHMTVAENIGFGMTLARRPKAEIHAAVQQAAEILQLSAYLDRKPKALSGGQRQRVAIGRAITRKPKVFLFDEPLSNLDAALRGQMRVELSELHRKLGATMVYVTHDQVEAMTMADQIVVLQAGRIEQIGAPMQLYNQPATPFVAGFIGSPKMNLLSGEVAKRYNCDTYGIRPEHIALNKQSGTWRGILRYAEHLGSDTIAHVDVDGLGAITARASGAIQLHPGDQVFLTPEANAEHRFVGGKRLG